MRRAKVAYTAVLLYHNICIYVYIYICERRMTNQVTLVTINTWVLCVTFTSIGCKVFPQITNWFLQQIQFQIRCKYRIFKYKYKYSATNTKQQVAVVMVMHVKPSLVANFNHSGQSWRAEENSPPALKLNQVATFCSCFRKTELLLHLLKNNPNLSLQLESS